jgi:hypothetical protein
MRTSKFSTEEALQNYNLIKIQDSSVGIATGYEVDGRSSILGRGKRFFSTPQRPGAHPSSFPMGNVGFFPEGKEAGTSSQPLTSI